MDYLKMLPGEMSIAELIEVKGGLANPSSECAEGSAVSCLSGAAVVNCTAPGSGVIINQEPYEDHD